MVNSVVFSKSDNADIRRVVYVPKYDAEVEYLQSTVGQDVAKPIVKRYVVPMPYDRRVEYLESTGTQYIDLDYICSTNTIISITVLPTQMKLQQRFIGCNGGYFEIYHNGSGYYGFASNGTTNVSSIKVNTTSKRKLTLNNVTAKGYVDNTATTISKNTSKYFNKLFLLTRPSYHPERAAVCRLYAASITDGDFKMDLIPVRKNGIGYMYDRVSGKLFGNAGTGQFILGNDIN